MADYNSDRTGSNIDLTLDKVDALDAKVQPTATGVDVTGRLTADSVSAQSISGITASSGAGTARMIGVSAGAYFGSATDTPVVFQVNQSEKMRIDSAGRVGVGTSAPDAPLEVKTKYSYANTSNGGLKVRNYSLDDYCSISNVSGTRIFDNSEYFGGADHYADKTYSSGIIFGADRISFTFDTGLTPSTSFRPTPRMSLDNSGNVGIGESDPSGYWAQASDLVLGGAGNHGVTIKSASTGNGRLVFTDTKSSTAGLNDGGMISYGHSSDVMTFQTNGTEAARIDSSGNLLVGTTTGTGKVSVAGNIQSDRALYRLRTTSPTIGADSSGSVSFSVGTINSANRGVFEISIFGFRNGGIEQSGAVMHLYMMGNPDDIEQPVVISEKRITVGSATLSSGVLTINFTNNGSFSLIGIKASLRQICEG